MPTVSTASSGAGATLWNEPSSEPLSCLERPMSNHLFERDGRFCVPTPLTRGPWTDAATHGGPPAALLAHAIESERSDPELFVSRITIDLFRPVPIKPLELKTAVVREGRRIKLVDAFLLSGGEPVARATGLLLRKNPDHAGETTLSASRAIPAWDTVPIQHFDMDAQETAKRMAAGQGNARFNTRVEVRRIDPPHAGGPMAAWMRLPFTLFPGQPLTALERVGGVADYASVIGILSRGDRLLFINADVNIALHREPEGEWICLESAGRGDHDGIASSSVHLHDSRGLFGHAFANGLVNG